MSRSQPRLSGKQRRSMVQRVADRDGWFCWWCGIPLVMDPGEIRDAATIDHRITLAAGGDNSFENSLIACAPCNQERGCLTAETYRLQARPRYRPPESADNCVPLSIPQRIRCGTLVSRGDAELLDLELGKRVIGSIVHENATMFKNRMWRIEQRAAAAQPDKAGPPNPGTTPRGRAPRELPRDAWRPPAAELEPTG